MTYLLFKIYIITVKNNIYILYIRKKDFKELKRLKNLTGLFGMKSLIDRFLRLVF